MYKLTVPRLKPAPVSPYGPRPLRHTLDRIAILNNSAYTPGNRKQLTSLLAAHWRASGIEVIELSGTAAFVEADLLFLNLSRPVVPDDYVRFAAQYPVTFNAGSTDLRKAGYADGLLQAGDTYTGPVIVRSDPGHPAPAKAPASRPGFFQRLGGPQRVPAATGLAPGANDNYRIYPSLRDVPAEKFGPGYIVQKFLPEENAGRYILRQYDFLGDTHFLSLQTSGAAIIRASAPQSLEAWTPPEKLLALRQRLGLDYGRISFVEVAGEPFVLSVSRSPSLPASQAPGYVPPACYRLAETLAEAMVEIYTTTEKAVF